MSKSKLRSSALKPASRKHSRAAAENSNRSSQSDTQKAANVRAMAAAALNGTPGSLHAVAQNQIQPLNRATPNDIAEKIKELVRLAQEQGYLTYNDINDALPDTVISPEEMDEIYVKLRNLEIEIVDQAEVDRVKQPEPEEEEEKTRLDILDDPVRMYLKQMGQVPQLTSRDLQTHRGRRKRGQTDHLQLRVRRQGAHCPG
jgi:RNA polymerase primary sigma factor